MISGEASEFDRIQNALQLFVLIRFQPAHKPTHTVFCFIKFSAMVGFHILESCRNNLRDPNIVGRGGSIVRDIQNIGGLATEIP